MFFGMFLRGQSAEVLRAQIDVPPRLAMKWMQQPAYDPEFQEYIKRAYVYRKQVLGIFDSLVTSSRSDTASQ